MAEETNLKLKPVEMQRGCEGIYSAVKSIKYDFNEINELENVKFENYDALV